VQLQLQFCALLCQQCELPFALVASPTMRQNNKNDLLLFNNLIISK